MRNKGTIAALVIILIAGLGLYFAYVNRDIQDTRLPATTSTGNNEIYATSARTTTAETTSTSAASPETTSTQTITTTTTTTTTAAAASGITVTTKPAESTTKGPYPYDYPGIAPAVAAVPADMYMICVNRNFSLPAGYSPALAVCVDVYPEKIQMEKTAAAQYKLMYNAGTKDGVELVPYSGYRATSRQKGNFDRKIESYIGQGYSRAQAVNMAAKSINPPGCSEHEAGLAIDITVKNVWNAVDSFKNTKEYEWLMKNAQDYGFILRYPANKEEITQVKFEPWHWRYVGVDNAKKIKESGKCLEEYLGLA